MKDLIKQHFKYIVIGISLLLSAIILGMSFFLIEAKKSESIERQKTAEITQQDKKLELEKEQYVSKRAKECNDLYYTETKRFSNVLYHEYKKHTDECIVTYERYKPKICKSDDLECLINATFTKNF